MIKFLKNIYVVQEKKKDYRTLRRFNPYNPLTYITILITLIIGLLLFGIKGLWSEINIEEFKFKYR